jgi:hypothetical protein
LIDEDMDAPSEKMKVNSLDAMQADWALTLRFSIFVLASIEANYYVDLMS